MIQITSERKTLSPSIGTKSIRQVIFLFFFHDFFLTHIPLVHFSLFVLRSSPLPPHNDVKVGKSTIHAMMLRTYNKNNETNLLVFSSNKIKNFLPDTQKLECYHLTEIWIENWCWLIFRSSYSSARSNIAHNTSLPFSLFGSFLLFPFFLFAPFIITDSFPTRVEERIKSVDFPSRSLVNHG